MRLPLVANGELPERTTCSQALVYGIPIRTSQFVPEGQVLRIDGAIWFHSRLSARGRKRRRHGRPRNAPRLLKVRHVRYQPDLDRLRRVVS